MSTTIRIAERIAGLTNAKNIATRFPPEPNGHLHIGHLKSLWLNCGIAKELGGACQLRFDDTNPKTEKGSYVGSAVKALGWMHYHVVTAGFASDYYLWISWCAAALVLWAFSYVDQQGIEQHKISKGSFRRAGNESTARLLGPKVNCWLLKQMQFGRFKSGTKAVRAKANMRASNLNLRDPTLFRIVYAAHYRTKQCWNVYPAYDFAHCASDYAEGITYSLCTLEFTNNRSLYCWIIDVLQRTATTLQSIWPKQVEFARLTLCGFQASKRSVHQLTKRSRIKSWDDLRLCSAASFRRSGFNQRAIEEASTTTGLGRSQASLPLSALYGFCRKELEGHAPRRITAGWNTRLTYENRWLYNNNNQQADLKAFPNGTTEQKITATTKEQTTGANGFFQVHSRFWEPNQFMKRKVFWVVGVNRSQDGKLVWRYIASQQSNSNAAAKISPEECWANTNESRTSGSQNSCHTWYSSSLGPMALGEKVTTLLPRFGGSINSWTTRGLRCFTGVVGCLVTDNKRRRSPSARRITTKLNFVARS